MKDYDQYLGRIRERRGVADYDALFGKISGEIKARRVRTRAAVAGVFLLLVVGFFSLSSVPNQGSEALLNEYLYRQSQVVDGPVINYVFSD